MTKFGKAEFEEGKTNKQPLLQMLFLKLNRSGNDKYMQVKLITVILTERNYSAQELMCFQVILSSRKTIPCIEY